MGGGLLAGTPSVGPSNTVKSMAVALTGKGSRKNTVGQGWGSRRGERDGHPRETHPGPRRHTHKGHTGPHGSMRTQSHEDTKEDQGRGRGEGRHSQRNGDGRAWSRDSPAGCPPPQHAGPGLARQDEPRRTGQLAAVPHGARRWAPEQGPAGGGWAHAPGSGGCCRPRAALCPLGLCRRCSCRQLQCSPPWVRRVFHSRACGSRAGHRAPRVRLE